MYIKVFLKIIGFIITLTSFLIVSGIIGYLIEHITFVDALFRPANWISAIVGTFVFCILVSKVKEKEEKPDEDSDFTYTVE